MSEHMVTSNDEEVRGRRGTVARCTCGWKSAWAVRDGSAEADGHGHLRTYDEGYRARELARSEAWSQGLRDRGCVCKHPGGLVLVLDIACAMHRPIPRAAPISDWHDHNCSCHLSAPCGQCESCKHYDHPECTNDCQTCEEHDDD